MLLRLTLLLGRLWRWTAGWDCRSVDRTRRAESCWLSCSSLSCMLRTSVLICMDKRLIAVALLLVSSVAWAQNRPEDGGHEIQVWAGGGPSVPGGTSDTSVWNVGLRYGWILTQPPTSLPDRSSPAPRSSPQSPEPAPSPSLSSTCALQPWTNNNAHDPPTDAIRPAIPC